MRISISLNGAFNLRFGQTLATANEVARRQILPELVYHIAFLPIATVN